MEQLTLRDREPRTSQSFAHLSVNIRIRMKKYGSEVRQLKNKVEEASRKRNMYPLLKQIALIKIESKIYLRKISFKLELVVQ